MQERAATEISENERCPRSSTQILIPRTVSPLQPRLMLHSLFFWVTAQISGNTFLIFVRETAQEPSGTQASRPNSSHGKPAAASLDAPFSFPWAPAQISGNTFLIFVRETAQTAPKEPFGTQASRPDAEHGKPAVASLDALFPSAFDESMR